MRLQEDLLAHDLRRQQPVRQVRQIVIGIEVRSLRHRARERVHQRVQPIAGRRTDHVGRLERRQHRERGGQRQQARHRHQIDLVEDQPASPPGVAQPLGDGARLLVRAPFGIDQQQDQVGILRPAPGCRYHGAVQPPAWAKNARRVHQQDLAVAARQDAEDAKPRGLRLRRHDRQPGARQPIEQRRLSGVRRPDDRHEAAARGHRATPRSPTPCSPTPCRRASAASCSAARLLPAVPVPLNSPAETVTSNTGACGGPERAVTW